MVRIIKPTESNILLALAQYKFLTTSQLMRLGVTKNRSHLSRILSQLKADKPLVATISFSKGNRGNKTFDPHQEPYENVAYLLPRGVKTLMHEFQMQLQNINYPKGQDISYKDYYHRHRTIDCHISLSASTQKNDLELLFFHRYFDKIGNNRTLKNLRAKTKIDLTNNRYIIADASFAIEAPKHTELYCIEMHNGKESKRILKELANYFEALQLGSPTKKYQQEYGCKRGARILNVFTYPNTMKAVLRRIVEEKILHPKAYKFYLFKTWEEVKNGGNFFEDWHTIGGEKARMY